MTHKTVERLSMPGFAIAIVISLVIALPIKAVVKNNPEMLNLLGPLAASAGMLLSFAVCLLVFSALVAPPVLLWNHYKDREIPELEVQPKQVTYGYQTPVPR